VWVSQQRVTSSLCVVPTRRSRVHQTHARSHRGANYRSFTVRQIRYSNIQPVVAKNIDAYKAKQCCASNEQSEFRPGQDGLNRVFMQSWCVAKEQKIVHSHINIVTLLLFFCRARSFVRHARTHKREKCGNMCLSEGQLLSANSWSPSVWLPTAADALSDGISASVYVC
jgi:hypothetical protein